MIKKSYYVTPLSSGDRHRPFFDYAVQFQDPVDYNASIVWLQETLDEVCATMEFFHDARKHWPGLAIGFAGEVRESKIHLEHCDANGNVEQSEEMVPTYVLYLTSKQMMLLIIAHPSP